MRVNKNNIYKIYSISSILIYLRDSVKNYTYYVIYNNFQNYSIIIRI